MDNFRAYVKQFIYDNFDGPKDLIVAFLMLLGTIMVMSVGIWAAFAYLPLWGSLMVIGGCLIMIGGLISES